MKKPLVSCFGASNRRGLAVCFLFSAAGLLVLYATGVFPTAHALTQDSEVFQAGAGEHASWAADAFVGRAEETAYPDGSRNKVASDAITPTSPAATTGGGLTILPTFDGSITGNPNGIAIQAMINQAVAIYRARFSDLITVKILFRYANTEVNGTALPPGILARSNFVIYNIPWNTYINALIGAARTANDTTANASLPASPLSTNIVPSSAGGRAVGLNTAGLMFANGMVGQGGTFDGIVTINSNQSFAFTRPPSANNYDALRSTEHEIDEILGLGSNVNIGSDRRPQDLFSWSAPGTRSFVSTGSRYFSINSGNTNIVNFNQGTNGDSGDWLSDPCPNQANPYVQNAFSCKGQFSDVTATSPEGINLDVIGYDLVSSNPSPTPPANTVFGNISTRLRIETGNNVLIGGFIVTGTQSKKVILRAIGPSLPLAGTISDPILELRNSSGDLIALNDDWQTRPDGTSQQAEIEATGIPPSHVFESALVATLPANNSAYTAIVYGYQFATRPTGIGLVEAYDLNQAVDSKLANISTRGYVTTGDNVMIGGTIIIGSNQTTVLLRAIGPSLANVGVANALSDTTLELRDSNGALMAYNDDWRRGGQEAEIIETGIPPTNDLESAILLNLAPAAYTAIVRGYSNAYVTYTGVALVEAYQLQ